MWKKLLPGVVLISLVVLSSVSGEEEGFSENGPSYEGLGNLIAGVKENCLERPNALLCYYRSSNNQNDYHPSEALISKLPSENQQENLLETEEPQYRLYKRFLMPRRKNPTARGYKRGPGFRSWGGKRDSIPSGQDIESKAKFGPWGGKRDEENYPEDYSEEVKEKRTKFQNWGGKRSDEGSVFLNMTPGSKRGSIFKERRLYLNEPFNKELPKRPHFQSWGGKRGTHPWSKFFWFLKSNTPTYSIAGGEKRKFSSWGGKRQEKNNNDVYQSISSDKKSSSDDNTSVKTIKTNWEGDEVSFNSNGWGDKGEGENNKR